MRKRGSIFPVLMIVAVFAISGCETVPKKFKEDLGGIKTRVETLESRVDTVEAKQSDAERMVSQSSEALKEVYPKTNISTRPRGKSKEDIIQIQTCLKNAGFYDGDIDGIKGRRTRKAIREFQESRALSADGIVGKKTWEVLSGYSQASASSAIMTEEGGSGK